jgi:hypothetical protein
MLSGEFVVLQGGAGGLSLCVCRAAVGIPCSLSGADEILPGPTS